MKKIILAAAILAALCIPALAVDLNAQITQLDGKPLVDQYGKEVPMTVGYVVKNALLYTDQQTTAEEKKKFFWLAVKVGEAEEAKKDIVFTPQELTDIEKQLDKSQTTLIAGQAERLIDPTFQPPK